MKENRPLYKGTAPWRTFSIFISSTFADMQAERDYLKQFVFPKIDEELRKRCIHLEVVDLRWGVDTASLKQEDEREANVLKVCLEEIKRCRPFFIGLLGDRYGWVPSEMRMQDSVIGEGLKIQLKGKSVTALEMEFGVLASREQLSRSIFYFRKSLEYDKLDPERAAMFSDQHNPALSEAEKVERIRALENLKASIEEHFKEKKLPQKTKSYTVKWDENHRKVTGLEAWGSVVYDDILEECRSHAAETWDQAPHNWQEQERALLNAFVETHISRFCGRKALLEKIRQHLLDPGDKNWGMILTGESGSGKSAVFSMLYRMMLPRDFFVLAHSAGLSPRAKNIVDLLLMWNKQLSDHLGIEEEIPAAEFKHADIPGAGMEKERKPEIEQLQERFRGLLLAAAEKGRVLLLIDALDRFEATERAAYMTWLPTVMPGKVRMLCTAIDGTERKAVEYHSGLIAKNIDTFTREEAQETLTMLCRMEHKNLPASVGKAIMDKKREDELYAVSSPLWLSLGVHMLMAIDHDDFEKMRKLEGRSDEVIEAYLLRLAGEFPPLPGKLFLNLVDKAASIFDREFTGMVFNYIACSRNGLREGDLEKLAPAGKDEKWDALLFANLRRWFRAHLREEAEGRQWNLAHSILRNSLIERLDDKANKACHQNIASHLLSLPSGDGLRISETMYHLMMAGNTKQGLDYYISDLMAEEMSGATKVLAEAIAADEKGIKWAESLVDATDDHDEKAWGLAPRFIYDLNDALNMEGRLGERLQILKPLEVRLKQTGDEYIYHQHHGYNYAALNEKLGAIHQAMGHMEEALKCFEKGSLLGEELYAANPKNESLKNGLAISYSKLGDIHQAMGHMEEALKYFEKRSLLGEELYAANPKNESLKNGLAISYSKLGDIHQAMGHMEEALKYFEKRSLLGEELYAANPKNESLKNGLAISYSKLGDIHQAMGHMEEALKYFEKGSLLGEELYAANPKNESLKNGLAISYSKLGDIHQAMGHMEEALKYFEKDLKLTEELYAANPKNESLKNGLAISYEKLGAIHQAMGHMEEALKYFEDEVKLFEELYAANPKNESLKNGLAISYSKLGDIHQAMGHMEEALKYFEDEVKLFEELYAANPKNESLKNGLAISYEKLGAIHQAMGHMEEALKYFEDEVKLFEELYAANPKNESLKNGLAISYSKLGDIHQAMGHMEEALKYFEKRSLLGEELYAANPKNESLKNGLAISYSKLGDIHQAMGHMEEALKYFEKRSLLGEELYAANPKNESLKNGLAISYSKLGDIHQAMGHMEEALKYFEKGSLLGEELYAANPKNESLKNGLAISYSKLGDIHQAMGHMEEALKYFEKRSLLGEELYAANPKNESLKNGLAISYSKLGDIHQAMGHMEEALKYFEKDLKLTEELYAANPKNESLKNGLAISYSKLGDIHQAMGHMEEALKYFEDEVKLFEELYAANPKNIGLLEGLGISYYKLAMIHKAMRNDPMGKEKFVQWKQIISHLAKNLPQVPKYSQWNKANY